MSSKERPTILTVNYFNNVKRRKQKQQRDII
jgi:hypothetical protein